MKENGSCWLMFKTDSILSLKKKGNNDSCQNNQEIDKAILNSSDCFDKRKKKKIEKV